MKQRNRSLILFNLKADYSLITLRRHGARTNRHNRIEWEIEGSDAGIVFNFA